MKRWSFSVPNVEAVKVCYVQIECSIWKLMVKKKMALQMAQIFLAVISDHCDELICSPISSKYPPSTTEQQQQQQQQQDDDDEEQEQEEEQQKQDGDEEENEQEDDDDE